jgi:DNA repair exonuclease SbcCD ATPase subunit
MGSRTRTAGGGGSGQDGQGATAIVEAKPTPAALLEDVLATLKPDQARAEATACELARREARGVAVDVQELARVLTEAGKPADWFAGLVAAARARIEIRKDLESMDAAREALARSQESYRGVCDEVRRVIEAAEMRKREAADIVAACEADIRRAGKAQALLIEHAPTHLRKALETARTRARDAAERLRMTERRANEATLRLDDLQRRAGLVIAGTDEHAQLKVDVEAARDSKAAALHQLEQARGENRAAAEGEVAAMSAVMEA